MVFLQPPTPLAVATACSVAAGAEGVDFAVEGWESMNPEQRSRDKGEIALLAVEFYNLMAHQVQTKFDVETDIMIAKASK